MATKKTWDDVLRERGFDPEQRKSKQAAKQTLDLPSNRYTLLESQIRQVSGIEQAQRAAAEADAIKALDRLKTLTLGGFDETKLERPPMVRPEAWREALIRNTPSLTEVLPRLEAGNTDLTNEEANAYAEKLHKEQEKLYSDKKEKKPWYKYTGWDLIKGIFGGLKQKKDMTLEERLAADAEYRKKIGGQPAAYLGSKAEEGLLRYHQGLWNVPATIAELVSPESKTSRDLKKAQTAFENWININQELNQPASEGQKILGDVISSTTQMMPSLIIRTFSPIAGDLAFGIPVVGTSAREAELEGANPAQQLAYGLTSGAAETAIERIAFFKPLEKLMPKGVFSDVVKAGTANMKKSLLSIGWDTLKAMGGEAFEEAIADPISGLAKKVIYDHDKPWLGENGVVDLKAMAYDALIGGITGGVFSLPTMPFNVSDALAVKKYIDENYDATLILAQGLPEEYASHQKAVEYTKNVYPISYNELIDLQAQVAKDLADYAQKVSKREAAATEAVTPAEPTDINKQTIPETLQETAQVTEQPVESVESIESEKSEEPVKSEKLSLDEKIAKLTKVDEIIRSTYGDEAFNRLEQGKSELLSITSGMPDTSVNQRRYETYREFIRDVVPEASEQQIDNAIKELRQMEIEYPPSREEALRRIEYLVDKIRSEAGQAKLEAELRGAERTEGTTTETALPEAVATAETKTEETTTETKEPEATEAEAQKETETKTSAQQEQAKTVPAYEVGDTVTLKHGGITRTITITEIGSIAIKGVTDKGTTIQYGKKVFENSIANVVKAQTEPEANTQSEPQAVSIDTSKYGRSGQTALKKWSQNEYINADLTKPENEYTQKWIQLFDKYYNLGRENKPMPLTFEQGELEAEFPPFILDEIYRAGKADYEAQQKKEAKKAEKEKVPISESKTANVGYHAGDLGKAEHFARQYGSPRDTGHFGTGTYFVSNMKELESGSYKERPIHEVDLSGYNLFKPKNAAEAKKLHDLLKYINRYHNTAQKTLLTQEQIDDLRYAEPDRIIQELKNLGEFDNEDFEDAVGMTADEYIKSGQDNTEATHYLKKAIENLERTQKQIEKAKNEQKYFEEWADKLFGLPEGTAVKILNDVWNEISKQIEGVSSMDIVLGDIGKTDSASTRFMKALGYEGVDVRHIPEFDNTSYGTVVYDLRESKKTEPVKTEEKQVEANREKGGIIEKKEGEKDGENKVSSDQDRTDISETPENVPPEDVQGSVGQRGTGETRLSEARGTERRDGGPDTERTDMGSGLGDHTARNTDTGRTRTGEQHTGNRSRNVQLNQHSNPRGTDYVINSQEDSIIDKGKKTRYANNVAAIKLMKQIEAEGRLATPEEQKILAKYVGWGGIPEVFSERLVYNPEKKEYERKPQYDDWQKEYYELKDLLTEEEYRQANDTILNAHYTSIDVIKAMYEGLRHFGFDGGRVLEPAVGIGNFIGAMPADMRSNVRVMTGIEIDSITGRIAKLLYPNADIRVQGFEKAKLPTGYYDVAISNVPFGQIAINDSRYPNSITKSIHNYFFAKALDVVRPGGIVMFITSSKTMDSKDTSGIRAYIKSKADLIGAIRLPNTAFKENAMTEVTTDIIILKVREKGTEYKGEAFQEMRSTTVKSDYYDTSAEVNEYFINHPENVLGELRYGRDMSGYYNVYVKGDGRDIGKAVTEVLNKMPAGIYEPAKTTTDKAASGPKIVRDASKGVKEGSYEVVNGKLTVNRDGKLVEVDRSVDEKEIKTISKMIEIKNKARELLAAQRVNAPESEITKLRKELNKLYDNFVKEYGYLNSSKNRKLLADDPDISFLLSLEKYTKPKNANKKTGDAAVKESATKGDIFFKNTVAPAKKVDQVATAKEALVVSLNEKGRVDINRIMELTGKEESEVVKELAGRIYKNPVTGGYETADEYLSGNVKAKLREAEAYAINEPEYKTNVEALKNVQPPDKEAWQISLKLGSSLIGEDIYSEFAKHLFGGMAKIEIRQVKHTGVWTVKESDKAKRYTSIKNLQGILLHGV